MADTKRVDGSSAGSAEVLVAIAQIDPKIGDKAANIARHLGLLEEAAGKGASLVVFPECSLTGYCFNSLEEAQAQAETVPGPTTDPIARACQRLGVHTAVGLLEREGELVYNSAALIGPQGVLAVYRKTHLPFLGVDRFVTPGPGPFTVVETPFGRVSMLICYDTRFPEPSRALALRGVEVILHLTNLPFGSKVSGDLLVPARAAENYVYVVSANRVGRERGTLFLGGSKVVDQEGTIVVRGSDDKEELLFAGIIPANARDKHRVRIAGEDEMDLFNDRRPELYGPLIESPRQRR